MPQYLEHTKAGTYLFQRLNLEFGSAGTPRGVKLVTEAHLADPLVQRALETGRLRLLDTDAHDALKAKLEAPPAEDLIEVVSEEPAAPEEVSAEEILDQRVEAPAEEEAADEEEASEDETPATEEATPPVADAPDPAAFRRLPVSDMRAFVAARDLGEEVAGKTKGQLASSYQKWFDRQI